MNKEFFKLIPKVSSCIGYTAHGGAASHEPANEASIADIRKIQKELLADCCGEKEPEPERYAWLLNKTLFVYKKRYRYAGGNPAAIVRTIADRNALFFDYDPAAKNSYLNRRAIPNGRVDRKTYIGIRDSALADFCQSLNAKKGQPFAQRARDTAQRLIDQIEAERSRAGRSLFQWLYTDAHMKVPRRNYAELKELYARENLDNKTPTPAQIRKKIRDEQIAYHTELLSDAVLHQDYSRLLSGAEDAALLVDSDFRSAFLDHVLLPLIRQYKYWQSWKEYPLEECDPSAHNIAEFCERMGEIHRLQERAKELALKPNAKMYSLIFNEPINVVPDADCSAHLSSKAIDAILKFYQDMGKTDISERDKINLSSNISTLSVSSAACSTDARFPIIAMLLIARYKRRLLNPMARVRAFGEENDYNRPYFGKSIAPSQQRLRYLKLLCTLCTQLEISEEDTAHNLNDFICFFGWQKMSDKELWLWRSLALQYGYENIPAVGLSLRLYEYGMECLPASYFDLSCRMIRPLQQDAFLRLCRKNETHLQSAYQAAAQNIRLFATQYVSLLAKEWFYQVERYEDLGKEVEKDGYFSKIFGEIDLSKCRLYIDMAVPCEKPRLIQQIGDEWSLPLHSKLPPRQAIFAKKIVRQRYGKTDADRQELHLRFAELLTRKYIRNQALKILFKDTDTVFETHTSAFFKSENPPGWFSYKKELAITPSEKDDCVR